MSCVASWYTADALAAGLQVVVLYVEMEESVKRQMLRATMATQHNKRAADAGSEDIWMCAPRTWMLLSADGGMKSSE